MSSTPKYTDEQLKVAALKQEIHCLREELAKRQIEKDDLRAELNGANHLVEELRIENRELLIAAKLSECKLEEARELLPRQFRLEATPYNPPYRDGR